MPKFVCSHSLSITAKPISPSKKMRIRLFLDASQSLSCSISLFEDPALSLDVNFQIGEKEKNRLLEQTIIKVVKTAINRILVDPNSKSFQLMVPPSLSLFSLPSTWKCNWQQFKNQKPDFVQQKKKKKSLGILKITGFPFPISHLADKWQIFQCCSLFPLVYEAIGVAAADRNGLSDPYCVVKLGKESKRTKIHPKTLNPKWGQTFVFK